MTRHHQQTLTVLLPGDAVKVKSTVKCLDIGPHNHWLEMYLSHLSVMYKVGLLSERQKKCLVLGNPTDSTFLGAYSNLF